MFHRIGDGIGCTTAAQLDAFFARLATRYNCVLPGEPLAADRLNVCVSFDDSYYCFYRTVWPLLRKHRLRAVLAVSAELIPETVDLAAAERLAAPGRSRSPERVTNGLCTWFELNEIVSSGVAMIAAHGATHARLDALDSDLTREIIGSGQLLERRLGVPIECFVFRTAAIPRPRCGVPARPIGTRCVSGRRRTVRGTLGCSIVWAPTGPTSPASSPRDTFAACA